MARVARLERRSWKLLSGQGQTLTGNPLDGGRLTGREVGLLWAQVRFLQDVG